MHSRIDLHMHSMASDGTDSPQKLAEKMPALGIYTFALTDHDTASGVEQPAGKFPEDVHFISGIKFSCRTDMGEFHILGYCCDAAHPAFRSAVAGGAERRRGKLEKRPDFLRERNIVFPPEEIARLNQLPSAGKPHLAGLMVQYGYAPERQAAFANTLNHCHVEGERIFLTYCS